jgi:hypothetical protein
VRLHAIGGLCNRLRAILSRRFSSVNDLTVVWDVNEYVSGARWDDVFMPMLGVTFEHHDGWTGSGWDVEDFAPAKDAPDGWERAYAELRPVTNIRQRIAVAMSALGEYSAMHVRRTDHVPNQESLGAHVEPLEDWILWAEKVAQQNVWVATDNGETQQTLSERLRFYGMQASLTWLQGAATQGLEDHRRNGTLADAVVDLYVCAAAKYFKGSQGSSFTDTIEILRREMRGADEDDGLEWLRKTKGDRE